MTLRVDVRGARVLLRCYGAWALLTADRRLPSACGYRRITGRPCPFCGLTRSVGHALRGRPRGHRLGPVVAVAVLADLAVALASAAGLRWRS